ncbi:hypothetical protein OIU79_006920 [Salix purpurea]|uniref:Uncharacterized protein n=1 Tax=Salix purpurea TaxID=77065 RepID=A0A9Q0TWK4_SALPP|nr:hypothetical protein OIU79_006920 [Salix purpurea]
MARTAMSMGLAMVSVSMLCAGAMAQSDCTSATIEHVTVPELHHEGTPPLHPHNAAFGYLVLFAHRLGACAEVLKGGGSSLGINVNQTRGDSLTRVLATCKLHPSAAAIMVPLQFASPSGNTGKLQAPLRVQHYVLLSTCSRETLTGVGTLDPKAVRVNEADGTSVEAPGGILNLFLCSSFSLALHMVKPSQRFF